MLMDHLETSLVFVQKIQNDEPMQLDFLQVPSLDFLIRKNIISMNNEWGAVDEKQESHPFTKTILFNNKIRITSNPEKIIIQNDMKTLDNLDELQKLGTKLLEKIQGIVYAGAGINFLSVMQSQSPGEEIRDRFLKFIPKLPIEKIIAGSFSYVYKKDDTRVTMTINPVKKNIENQEPENAISLNANYHLDRACGQLI